MGEFMRKYFTLYLLSSFFILIFVTAPVLALNPSSLSAATACVVDVETGQVLIDKNMHVKRPPASVTKILTTIIAIEEGKLDDEVTVSRKAAYQEGSSIYLSVGEKISLEELLYGVMLASGNDASMAVAEYISGSVEEFAKLMNKKAKLMGALNSNFVNPSGLPNGDHYSTAYDLAMIMRYALQNKTFARITATKNKTISWADNTWGRGLRNHNKLLWQYDDITGGKTGYTRAAGRCLIASAQKNGREIVAIVLKSSNDWLEVRNLLDFGLGNFKKIVVIKKGEVIYQMDWEESREGKIGLLAGRSISVLIPINGSTRIKKQVYLKPELELPIKKGEVIGELRISADKKIIGKTELLASNDINYNSIFLRFLNWINNSIGK